MTEAVPIARQLWDAFAAHVGHVQTLDVQPDNLSAYYALVSAYRALRAHYVTPRKGRRVRKGHDPALVGFVEQSTAFRNKFYGRDDGHYEGTGPDRQWVSKRNWLGVLPAVRLVMEAYGQLRNVWQHHTPEGKRQRAEAGRRHYATPQGKAAKAAYQASEAGKAAKARAAKTSKRKRVVARGATEQAMYDSWAIEDALEEAVANV